MTSQSGAHRGPCGVVIGLAKFAKAESPTNILDFLEEEVNSDNQIMYGLTKHVLCFVMLLQVEDGRNSRTQQFIVDLYHYINHCVTDNLCQKCCNPAPLNGSAPNLVTIS
jgi:hypothetical protein